MSVSQPVFADDQKIIDELRIGGFGSLQDTEKTGALAGTVFFDPFGRGDAPSLMDSLKHPRPFIGGEVGFGPTMNDQLYGGLAWTVDVTKKIFVEGGFGGVLHDGATNNSDRGGAVLGCKVLFREYAAVGYRLDDHWNVTTQIEHASNANLCDHNEGMTRVGMAVGYKF